MTRTEFVKLVRDQVGDKYVFGAETSPKDPDPDVFDCSELVQWAYARAGVGISDGSSNQYHETVAIGSPSEPGDLFFISGTYRPGISHVGIYVGNGQAVEAKSSRVGVIVSNVSEIQRRSGFSGWRRFPDLIAAFEEDEVSDNVYTAYVRPDDTAAITALEKWAQRHKQRLYVAYATDKGPRMKRVNPVSGTNF